MHFRIWIAAAVAVLALAIGVAAATSGSGTSVYTQLQKPATFAPHLSPNRASAPNRLTLQLPPGARVTVSFSMPSMDMWNGFTTTLTETAHGTYTANVPVLGMPGSWRMQFRVAPRGGAPYTVNVDDRLVG